MGLSLRQLGSTEMKILPQFVMRPGVAGAIVGARSSTQVDSWIPSTGLTLSEADLAELETAVRAAA